MKPPRASKIAAHVQNYSTQSYTNKFKTKYMQQKPWKQQLNGSQSPSAYLYRAHSSDSPSNSRDSLSFIQPREEPKTLPNPSHADRKILIKDTKSPASRTSNEQESRATQSIPPPAAELSNSSMNLPVLHQLSRSTKTSIISPPVNAVDLGIDLVARGSNLTVATDQLNDNGLRVLSYETQTRQIMQRSAKDLDAQFLAQLNSVCSQVTERLSSSKHKDRTTLQSGTSGSIRESNELNGTEECIRYFADLE